MLIVSKCVWWAKLAWLLALSIISCSQKEKQYWSFWRIYILTEKDMMSPCLLNVSDVTLRTFVPQTPLWQFLWRYKIKHNSLHVSLSLIFPVTDQTSTLQRRLCLFPTAPNPPFIHCNHILYPALFAFSACPVTFADNVFSYIATTPSASSCNWSRSVYCLYFPRSSVISQHAQVNGTPLQIMTHIQLREECLKLILLGIKLWQKG